jgi:hypothetical protein
MNRRQDGGNKRKGRYVVLLLLCATLQEEIYSEPLASSICIVILRFQVLTAVSLNVIIFLVWVSFSPHVEGELLTKRQR